KVKPLLDKLDEFLYIADGDFHPTAFLKYDKKITVINFQTGKKRVFGKEDLDQFKKQKKGKLLKFLHANKIGIIVSTKHGQYNLQDALRIKDAFPSKQSYLFFSDTLNTQGLEDFTGLDIFVNTACPRIQDKKIINHADIPKYLWEQKST
ncbi:hypothetical protein CL622_03765, partial [archaeon]|nr:hypothetical protein [archaeon]